MQPTNIYGNIQNLVNITASAMSSHTLIEDVINDLQILLHAQLMIHSLPMYEHYQPLYNQLDNLTHIQINTLSERISEELESNQQNTNITTLLRDTLNAINPYNYNNIQHIMTLLSSIFQTIMNIEPMNNIEELDSSISTITTAITEESNISHIHQQQSQSIQTDTPPSPNIQVGQFILNMQSQGTQTYPIFNPIQNPIQSTQSMQGNQFTFNSMQSQNIQENQSAFSQNCQDSQNIQEQLIEHSSSDSNVDNLSKNSHSSREI